MCMEKTLLPGSELPSGQCQKRDYTVLTARKEKMKRLLDESKALHWGIHLESSEY